MMQIIEKQKSTKCIAGAIPSYWGSQARETRLGCVP